jgi:VWFA-related protein
MLKHSFPKALACALALAFAAPPAGARQQPAPPPQQQTSPQQQEPARQSPAREQEPAQQQPVSVDADEVLQVNTRAVFLDVLVTDKKTRNHASDLRAENFEVLADGRPRQLTYFSREGDAGRRPLALVLVFDLRRSGAGRYLRRTEILEAMANELSKLPPSDEVAVLVLDATGQQGRREWLTPLTRNRAQTASALSLVPTLVGASVGTSEEEGGFSNVTLTAPSVEEMKVQLEDFDKAHRGQAGEADEVDQFVDKKGRVLTRTLKPSGTLLVQRVNKDGSTEVDVHSASDLPRASYEITRRLARERPNSQAAIVYVTDGIALMAYAERDYVEHRLLRQNVLFSALVTDMKTGFKLAKPLLAPLGNVIGLNIYGGAQHVAKETGGEVVRVGRPSDYAAGLARIIGNLNARYSLGFTLAEGEAADGRFHPLQVRARARDAKGKDRKLEVKTRRGYFTPAPAPARRQPEAATKPADAGSQTERVKN